jgi:hypothetical protein
MGLLLPKGCRLTFPKPILALDAVTWKWEVPSYSFRCTIHPIALGIQRFWVGAFVYFIFNAFLFAKIAPPVFIKTGGQEN